MKKIIGKYFMLVTALAITVSAFLVSILFYSLFHAQVFQVNKEIGSIWGILFTTVPLILIILAGLWLLCMALAKVVTGKILRPIREIAENIGNKQLMTTYEELQPLMEMIQNQHADILESAQIRQEFTANVSHELKTPLASISGYSELIEAGMVNEDDSRRFAAEIHKNANRLLSLINDILELSKLDNLSEELQIEAVDLYELLQNCANMLEINASKRGISIRVEGEETYVHGSKRMLEEVVYNLCDNAIRYNKESGKVLLKVTREAEAVILQVKDTGIGIPKEHHSRIFERFYRVDKSRSKSTGGTGLGLAIVKHIAAIHDATIELESEEDKGTCITLVFTPKV